MKPWLLPAAAFLAGCMVIPGGEPRPAGRSRMADDSMRLAEADSYVVRLLATVPGCAEEWDGRANWEEGLMFRVAPLPTKYAAINMCEKRNRVFISLLHVDDMDTAELARIMIHEAQHQAYCDFTSKGDKKFDKDESERWAQAAEDACFPPAPEQIGAEP